MKKTTLIILVFFIFSVFISTIVYAKGTNTVKTKKIVMKAEQAKTDPTVYVRENGKKFHKKNCRLVSGKKGIKLSEAIKKGYEPCKVCFNSELVYVTDKGKKYHKKDCKLVKNAKPIQIGVAELKGYEPCKACCSTPKVDKDKLKKGLKGKKIK